MTDDAEHSLKAYRLRVKPHLVVSNEDMPQPYEAFNAQDKTKSLDLRPSDGISHVIGYHYIIDVAYNRRTYAEIAITLGGMMVVIKGQRLRPIVEALRLRSCEFIEAYNAEYFQPPTDATAPLVESIDVTVLRGPVPQIKPQAG